MKRRIFWALILVSLAIVSVAISLALPMLKHGKGVKRTYKARLVEKKTYTQKKEYSKTKGVLDKVDSSEYIERKTPKNDLFVKKEDLYWLEWRDEYDRKPMTYKEYLSEHTYITEELPDLESTDKEVTEEEGDIKGAESDGDGKRPLVIIFVADYVNRGINPEIIKQYRDDLNEDGYTAVIKVWGNRGAEELKQYIVDVYNDPWSRGLILIHDSRLVGVVMVGNLPVPWYEFNDGCLGYNEFPSPLYYMDIDGNWEDTDENGKYDSHTGNIEPEIWCGWLNAKPLFNDRVLELEFLMDYFMRNHEFRQGHVMDNKFLVYNEDDFKSFVTPYMAYLVNPDNIITIKDYLETTNYDFLQRIAHIPITMEDGSLRPAPPDHYDWVDATIHGSANSLSFDLRFKDPDYLNPWSFDEVSVNPYFIILRSCGPGRFVEQDYIGGRLLLGPNRNTQVVISSTAPYYCFPFDEFYKELGREESIGEAFKSLIKDTFYNPYIDLRNLNDGGPDWPLGSVCHGFVILGDPTLKPKRYLPENLKGSQQVFEEYIKELRHPHDKPDFFIKNIFYIKEGEGQDYRVGFQWDCIMKQMISVGYPIEEYAGGTWSKFQMTLNPVDKGLLVDSWFDLAHFKYQVLIDGNLEEEGELIPFIIRNIMAYNTMTTDVIFSGREPHTITVRIVDPRNIIDESDEQNNSLEQEIPVMEENDIDLVPTSLSFYNKPGILYSSRIGWQGYYLSERGLSLSFINAGRELGDNESYEITLSVTCEEKGTEITGSRGIYKEITPLPYGWGWSERRVLEGLSANEEEPGTRLHFMMNIDSLNNVPEANDDNNSKTVELEVPF